MAKRYELSDEAWDVVSDVLIETLTKNRFIHLTLLITRTYLPNMKIQIRILNLRQTSR